MNIQSLHWDEISGNLDNRGFSKIPGLLTTEECHDLSRLYANDTLFRSTINMQRYRFGQGEYKYFSYPLPSVIQSIRDKFYPPLSLVANEWMRKLGIEEKFPNAHDELIQRCNIKNQQRPTPLMLHYQAGGFNTLHQDLYGEIYFPFQVVIMLSAPGKDYSGGEFVVTEQIPRAQSRATVIQPGQGDAVIFTTNFRPVKGARNFYRATMKHGVSAVTSGERFSLGIIFHDAK